MPEDIYEYPDDAYDALAAAGVHWQDTDFVLRHSRPVVRQHIGATSLLIFGRSRSGQWLVVSLYEVADDVYHVRAARYLNADESRATARHLGLEQ